ncbi:hypothetical protein PVAND_003722 [Polypedilum vanderplanki]|uniref:Apoptosis inhibitor 5 n=1 Tax=Polypedilum vanderplanki TaxID=319348 RepID=A0A9J6BVY5_POLVA|nr:hypothetical protein PVAND_003722 [Polypedilum vanderplanki]
MSLDKVDQLYQYYGILNDAKDKSEHQAEYMEIIKSAHGSEKEKRLATTFIPKFYKYFPDLSELAIDASLDLCEADDITIRRMAIKELPSYCRDSHENTPRISDILAQLLNASDPAEVQQVNLALKQISKIDPMGTITGLFNQITQGDENGRLKCLEFINNNFIKAEQEVQSKEKIEDFITSEIKKLLKDVSSDEFQQCIQILSKTKLGKTITGHQELVKICLEQVDLETDLNFGEAADDIVYIFLTCVNQALPFFSSKIESNPFVKYICDKLFPLENWHLIGVTDDQTQIQLRILKVFAELCSHSSSLEKPNECVEAIFNILIEYLPPPPVNLDESQGPSILFSHVECLLYAIHAIGKQCPEFLSFPNDPEKLKDFRARLQYLARRTQGYIKKLQDDVKGKNTVDPKTDEEKLKVMGLKTTSNIQVLIRDLYHPSFKSKIVLSWINEKAKKEKTENVDNGSSQKTTSNKRPITFSSGNNDSRSPKQRKINNSSGPKVYTPPSGKFSSRLNQQRNNFKSNPNKNKFRRGGGGGRNQRY